jgi:CRISPR-associated endonuclease Cas3-HD
MPYYAKTDKTELKSHLEMTRDMAKNLATNLKLSDHIVNLCTFAAYLHDIGKACPYFQNWCTGKSKKTDEPLRYHNEFSYIFLVQYKTAITQLYETLYKETLSNDDFIIIKTAVYWHHAQASDINNNDLLFILEKKDVNDSPIYNSSSICDFLSTELGINISCVDQPDELYVPKFFINKQAKNNLILIVRSIVIKSDWLVSSGSTFNATSYDHLALNQYVCPSAFDISRFNSQMEIISKASDKQTIICNAPAGFGKTFIGLVWALTTGKRIIWVCPRNAIIDNVYTSIISLLTALHLNITVETYYHNERQIANHTDDTPSRITITNIDAIVQPMASSSKGGLQYDMLDCTLIFDEYHEFISESPIYAAFSILVQARHNVLHAQQMFLSATPIELPLDYNDTDKLLVLPKKYKHFPAQHKNTYTCNVNTGFPAELEPDTFCIYNTIKNAQSHTNVICLHSKYTREDKANKFALLYKSYGKQNDGNKKPVSSAPIMQASLDVSASHLIESVSSPNNTMQRIGRCDRFGTCETRTITFIASNDKSESRYISNTYSTKLYKQWLTFIQTNMCGSFTLDELYTKYNTFNENNKKDIQDYLNGKYEKSFISLMTDCLPTRPKHDSSCKIDAVCSTGNIRNPEPNAFYLVWSTDSNKYVGPFSCSISDFKKEYNNYGYPDQKYIKNIANTLIDYPKLVDKIGINDSGKKARNKMKYYCANYKQLARWSDCPYPVNKNNKTYSTEKGIIDVNNDDDLTEDE